MNDDTLDRLEQTIRSRKGADASSSYVAQLLAKGSEKTAKKFGEEAVELVMASAQGNREHIVYEAADALFHMLVLLASHDVPFQDVLQELKKREGTSGIAEKAARKN